MKPLLISSGEPAGIGPDICLALAGSEIPVVVLGDRHVLEMRARQLGKPICFNDYDGDHVRSKLNHLTVLHVPCPDAVTAGQLNQNNVSYVINLLELGVKSCLSGDFSGLVTAPVHKAVINQAGIYFTGHTEFIAKQCGSTHVVMMLASTQMKVALATTHVPLKEVPSLITKDLLMRVIHTVHHALVHDFGIEIPRLLVAGLNPHAGESGYLGKEEIEIITPVLNQLTAQGFNLTGPLPADTLFTPKHLQHTDAVIAMYHDQGLAPLKYASFGQAVNVTLGLPIIRTSVDHGTALELAGSGMAHPGSLFAAIKMAFDMAETKHGKYQLNCSSR